MTTITDNDIVSKVLRAYRLEYKKILPPQKGYRNQSFPIVLPNDRKVNFILYKNEPGILEKIKAANAVSGFLADNGFPARRLESPRIICLNSVRQTRYGGLYNYLDGHTIPWEGYTQDHIKLLGKTMSDMHAALADFRYMALPEVADEYLAIISRMRSYFSDGQVQRAITNKLLLQVRPEVLDRFEQLLVGSRMLPSKQPLHMDFVRSNVLFDDKPLDDTLKISICGIIDFEKTAYGHPLFDVARTLAFLLVDCKYKPADKVRKYFLGSGYIKRGRANLDAKYMGMLESLTDMFLFYDFYKFLRHNPYEALPDNEHFIRTAEMLIQKHLVVPTTSIAH